MKNNHGPEKLIDEMKMLCGSESGFQIIGNLRANKLPLLLDFRPFKMFIETQRERYALNTQGEFYFNFADAGFTGIDRFDKGYLTIRTSPPISDISLEIFVSHLVENYRVISQAIYEETINFFDSEIIQENLRFQV
ncbi:MAG TPA: hypothetical protein VD884_16075 [Ohtaekwangia sp.]|nr:hypothetical protein [Ohtaekwangia sp.]